jgi:hypothetical protein
VAGVAVSDQHCQAIRAISAGSHDLVMPPAVWTPRA